MNAHPHGASRYIAWIDLETTGLDHAREAIAELAIVITSGDLYEIESYTTPVHVHGLYLDSMDPYVRDMHTRNGLLAELPGAPYATDVEAKVLDLLKAYTDLDEKGKPIKLPLCGSTVHFDRAFLRERMPRLERSFSHRHIDVSSFKECAKRWNERSYDIVDSEAHRALADVRGSIQALRDLRRAYWTREIGGAQ